MAVLASMQMIEHPTNAMAIVAMVVHINFALADQLDPWKWNDPNAHGQCT